MSVKINDLPKPYRHAALKERRRQERQPWFVSSNRLTSAFNWHKSVNGYDYWYRIYAHWTLFNELK